MINIFEDKKSKHLINFYSIMVVNDNIRKKSMAIDLRQIMDLDPVLRIRMFGPNPSF